MITMINSVFMITVVAEMINGRLAMVWKII